jgi:hypothetical protein
MCKITDVVIPSGFLRLSAQKAGCLTPPVLLMTSGRSGHPSTEGCDVIETGVLLFPSRTGRAATSCLKSGVHRN